MAMLTNQEIMALYSEMYATGNLAIAETIIAADFIDHAHPELPRGPVGVQQMVQRTNTAFTNVSITRTHILYDGAMIAFRFILSATHSGALGVIPPSGKQIMLEGMDFIRIAEAKMAELWSCQDTLGMLQQMGCALTVPPSP